MRVAIDSGGTFTDCVYVEDGELRVLKVFSTPARPGDAVLDAVVRAVGDGAAPEVRHGTTVGTNAMLERKGARVAYVTTAGFEDVIAIGRQARPSLYDWMRSPLPCVVAKGLRFGVQERVTAEGAVLCAPSDAELRALVEAVRASGAEAVALSTLFRSRIRRMSGQSRRRCRCRECRCQCRMRFCRSFASMSAERRLW